MTLRLHFIPALINCALISLLFATVVVAQPEDSPADSAEHAAETADGAESEAPPRVLQPRQSSDPMFSRRDSGANLNWLVYLALFLLIVLGGLWLYFRKSGFSLKTMATASQLRIRETKALGNRQFLVVVEYGEQRMLLGVAPGMINHLCYLEDPDGIEAIEASDTEAS